MTLQQRRLLAINAKKELFMYETSQASTEKERKKKDLVGVISVKYVHREEQTGIKRYRSDPSVVLAIAGGREGVAAGSGRCRQSMAASPFSATPSQALGCTCLRSGQKEADVGASSMALSWQVVASKGLPRCLLLSPGSSRATSASDLKLASSM